MTKYFIKFFFYTIHPNQADDQSSGPLTGKSLESFLLASCQLARACQLLACCSLLASLLGPNLAYATASATVTTKQIWKVTTFLAWLAPSWLALEPLRRSEVSARGAPAQLWHDGQGHERALAHSSHCSKRRPQAPTSTTRFSTPPRTASILRLAIRLAIAITAAGMARLSIARHLPLVRRFQRVARTPCATRA